MFESNLSMWEWSSLPTSFFSIPYHPLSLSFPLSYNWAFYAVPIKFSDQRGWNSAGRVNICPPILISKTSWLLAQTHVLITNSNNTPTSLKHDQIKLHWPPSFPFSNRLFVRFRHGCHDDSVSGSRSRVWCEKRCLCGQTIKIHFIRNADDIRRWHRHKIISSAFSRTKEIWRSFSIGQRLIYRQYFVERPRGTLTNTRELSVK